MKSLLGDSVITSDKITDTPEIVSINSNDQKATNNMGYYFFYTFLLATILLLKSLPFAITE